MIENLETTSDAAGFPIVRWIEWRPDAVVTGGRVVVECRIVKAPDTGALLFATRGVVRHGAYEEACPWEALRGFSVKSAADLYQSSAERSVRQKLAGKALLSNIVLAHREQVLLAEFATGTRLHLNAVDAAQVDVERLHLLLTKAFVTQRRELVGRLCDEAFRWPPQDDRVETYASTRAPPSSRQRTARTMVDLGFAVLIASAFVSLTAWVAIRLFR